MIRSDNKICYSAGCSVKYKRSSICFYVKSQMSNVSWCMMDKEKSNVIRQRQKPVEVRDSFKNRRSLGYSWSLKYFTEMRWGKKENEFKGGGGAWGCSSSGGGLRQKMKVFKCQAEKPGLYSTGRTITCRDLIASCQEKVKFITENAFKMKIMLKLNEFTYYFSFFPHSNQKHCTPTAKPGTYNLDVIFLYTL